MYSVVYLSRIAISLENRLAIKMKTEDVAVIEKRHYCKQISFGLFVEN